MLPAEEPVALQPTVAHVTVMFQFLLVERAASMAAVVALDSMAPSEETVPCVLSGPAQLVNFHQLTRGICNGSLYSNS
jgi:hypothetical protein